MKDISVLKWIYKNTGKRNLEIAVLIFLNAFSAVSVTLFAMFSKSVVDSAQKGNKDELVRNIIWFLTIILLQIVSRILSSFILAISQGKAEVCLKSSVFASVINGKYSQVTEKHSGDIMSRLTADVQFVCDHYISMLPNAISYAARMVSATIALYSLEKSFTIAVVFCGALVVAIAAIFRKQIKKIHRRVREKDAKVRAFMQEMIENLFAVKVFGIEEKVLKRSLKQQNSFYRAKVRQKSISIIAGISFSLMFTLGFLMAVTYGSYGILNGQMTFGTVVAIIQLVGQLRSPATGVTHVVPAFFSMTTSAQRLIELSEIEKDNIEYADVNYENFKKIRLEKVTFGYGKEKVIKEADFTIKKGEFIGIKGPSGAGKSTIFKLITGLYPVDSGKAVIETTLGEVDCKVAKKLFSFVPQDNMLFSGTVRDNITVLNPDVTEEEIQDAIRKASAEFVYDLDDGLDFVLGESGIGVSQGQAQRLAIVRALLGKGKILLMDESTSALDSETEKQIIDNLRNDYNITVLFITHREMVMEQCDRTITVADGCAWEE